MSEYVVNLCSMGGYGIYVWPCYVLLLGLLTWQIFAALKKNIAVHSKLKKDMWSGTNSDSQT